jgi:hypothetical protein
MYSAASEWREGLETWSVVHSSEDGPEHLAVAGEPPEGWTTIRDDFLAQQRSQARAEVDCVYEVPLALAERVVGYRSESEATQALDYVTLIADPGRSSRRRVWRSRAVLLIVLAVIGGLVAWRITSGRS